MNSRQLGKILCQHEERLVETGLDPDDAATIVDELEEELGALEIKSEPDDQNDVDDEQTEDVTSTDED